MALENTDTVQETAAQTAQTTQSTIQKLTTGETATTVKLLWAEYSDAILQFCRVLALSFLLVAFAWFLSRILQRVIRRVLKSSSPQGESIGAIIASFLTFVIWIMTLLSVLELFGVNTSSFLTVLGAAGLAVGLAMKDSLSNIASGLILLFLRPYKVGDYVECGSISGTITEIGLFCTFFKTFDGIFISAPNSSIFGNPIKNYSRNPFRRADITVGISYGDLLQTALDLLNDLMANHPAILKDPEPQVLVADLGDSSVNLTLRFWIKTADYWTVYWDIKKQLKDVIESAGLTIPFPQRVVTIASKQP